MSTLKKGVIFWDFDGVILNSNSVRDEGFRQALKSFPVGEVDKLIKFHQKNGGLSRYVKFRYFFEEIRGESVDESDLDKWIDIFGKIMREKLVNKDFLINEIVNFIKENNEDYTMFIVSGSDEKELRFLCREIEIDHLFEGIYGSPTPKITLVNRVISLNKIDKDRAFLVGDSINDKEAAEINGIRFYAYNNNELISSLQFDRSFLNG